MYGREMLIFTLKRILVVQMNINGKYENKHKEKVNNFKSTQRKFRKKTDYLIKTIGRME